MLLEKVRRAGGSVSGSKWALVEKGWRRWQNGKGEDLAQSQGCDGEMIEECREVVVMNVLCRRLLSIVLLNPAQAIAQQSI